MQRNQSIDLVKVLSMYLVLAIHVNVCRISYSFTNIASAFTIVGIAIPMFFMVSGFLMSHKFIGNDISYSYSLKKIFRILKFCFIICVFFDVFKYVSTKVVDFSFPFCLIKLGSFSVFWYFGAMILIYILLPLLINIINCSKNKFNLVLVVLLFVCFTIFILNYQYDFEKKIPNTFRLVNWISYFMLGAYIQRNSSIIHYVKWYYPVVGCILFTLTVLYGKQTNYELHFSSPFCIFYACSTFICCLKTNIHDSRILHVLSNIFLPFYAIHMTVIWHLLGLPIFKDIESSMSSPFSFILEWLFCASICTLTGIMIMKIPLVKTIFKI